MRRLSHPTVVVALVILASVLLFFWDVLFGDKVLLPLDNLFLFPPWNAFSSQFGISAPHNYLIGDAILENLVWKSLARDTIASGAIPLWNPYVFGGMPFMATGQPSVLYPLGVLFYVLPLLKAYAWFTALHLYLGGMFVYTYLRTIRVGWFGGLIAALAFTFSGFIVVSILWPMVISTVIWLPLILAFIELIIREVEGESPVRQYASPLPAQSSPVIGTRGLRPGRIILWALLAAGCFGMQFLAAHMEFSFYILFTAFFYSAFRLGALFLQTRRLAAFLGTGLLLCGIVALGTGLAAIQLIPFAEIAPANFRAALVTYQDVIGWALPKKHLLSFVVPNFFGNPSQHSFFDFVAGRMQSASHVFNGEVIATIHDWGPKNYVEGSAYVGILPLALALVAVLFRRNRYTLIFFAYAIWSLLLAFGTPLYRVFFYGVPGFDQLHTPFRWIFPYTISVVILAGLGADWLVQQFRQSARHSFDLVAGLVLAAGGGLLILLAAGLAIAQQLLPTADRLVENSQKLQESFANGQAFFSFEFGNLLALSLFLIASGLVLWLARCRLSLPLRLGSTGVWQPLAVAVVLADLVFFGYGFNSRTDPSLLKFTPPSMEVLKEDTDLFRVASYGYEDVLTPNTSMLFGLQDARGYDSVIPKQYAEYWKLMEDPSGLLYNRIHKLVQPASLSSPFLDLLNVKYVLTLENIDLPNYTEVYRGEVNIYRNDDYLPRAFVVPRARMVPNDAEALAEMRDPGFDPRSVVLLEKTSKTEPDVPATNESAAADAFEHSVHITSYQPNEVHVSVRSSAAGYLVLVDSYFPGWEVKVNGQPAQLYKADQNFRAVGIGPGESDIIFRYNPFSFKLGAFFSLISGLVLVLGLVVVVGRRLTPGFERAGTTGRVAKNSVTPMATQLLNKAIDVVFAMLMLRVLGPENVGKYTFAVIVIGYFEILTSFGLNTLVTREVAKDRSRGNRYLTNTTALRLLLTLGSAPIIALFLAIWESTAGLESSTAWAIVLLALALVPSNISAALSSLFYAHERMEYPAAVSVVTTLLKVVLGVVALLAGWGFVGLAAVSVVVNIATALIFAVLVRTVLFKPRLELDWLLVKEMLGVSWPLMLNILLATLFFRIDIVLLEYIKGATTVGFYATAYKFIDGLNIIPSTFTIALFPVLSRYAESSSESFTRAYVIAVRVLTMVSVPIAVATAFLAEPIVLLFGGDQFLPHSAIALQVVIWFLPFSYVNSVTQYVLIALNQQKFITVSFIVATTFNITANILLIPSHGYVGASIVTILSEIILLAPFLYCLRRQIRVLPLLSVSIRPVIAGGVMGAVLWWIQQANPFVLILTGAVVYLSALAVLGAFTRDDVALARRLLGREAAAAGIDAT